LIIKISGLIRFGLEIAGIWAEIVAKFIVKAAVE